MALTQGERTAIQALYGRILADLTARYGPSVKPEFSLTKRDNTGQVVSMVVAFNFLGVADPDGVQPLIRKEVDVW